MIACEFRGSERRLALGFRIGHQIASLLVQVHSYFYPNIFQSSDNMESKELDDEALVTSEEVSIIKYASL